MTTVEQSYGAHLYPRLGILAGGLFVVGTNAFVIAGLLPQIAHTLGVRANDVSYSITWYAIVVAIAAPAISILLPRVSRTTLMAVGLVLVSIGTVIAALAPTLTIFTLGRIVAAFGGAALVPAATAAAAMLAPAERRGRAIALVAIGFTAAIAFGAPLGTALAESFGWRVPLLAVAGFAAVTALAVAVFVRYIPLGEPVSASRRFAALADSRVLLGLVATLLVVSGFNVVYIFSAEITTVTTGGSGSLLAALLLVFGIGGIVGNVVVGPLVDRFGNRPVAIVLLLVQLAALFVLPLALPSFAATAVLFGIWGITANAIALPIQHRLVEVNPANAGVTLSWYSTAMYAGIALAPPIGAVALGAGHPLLVPEFGAGAVLLSLLAFLGGSVARRRAVVTA
jgi:MFS transporter, DHA1 family, inner membrane transport protein